jgi:RNA polymerase sigma-70 factor (ECF subfamily)
MPSRLKMRDLFVAESQKVTRFLRSLAPGSAEDVVQESFARLCAVDLGHVRSPRSYLFETARNVALNDLARQKRSPFSPISLDQAASKVATPSFDDDAEAAERWRMAEAAIEALPEHLRAPLLMHKLEEIPQAEIARRLGVSERTIKRRIAEALVQCHKAIRDASAEL